MEGSSRKSNVYYESFSREEEDMMEHIRYAATPKAIWV
jgi:hypothetical protein